MLLHSSANKIPFHCLHCALVQIHWWAGHMRAFTSHHWPDASWNTFPKLFFDESELTCGEILTKLPELSIERRKRQHLVIWSRLDLILTTNEPLPSSFESVPKPPLNGDHQPWLRRKDHECLVRVTGKKSDGMCEFFPLGSLHHKLPNQEPRTERNLWEKGNIAQTLLLHAPRRWRRCCLPADDKLLIDVTSLSLGQSDRWWRFELITGKGLSQH